MDPGDVCVYREKTPIEGPARGQLPETKTLDFEASRNVGGGGEVRCFISYITLSFPQKSTKHAKRKTITKQTKEQTNNNKKKQSEETQQTPEPHTMSLGKWSGIRWRWLPSSLMSILKNTKLYSLKG